MTSRSSSGPTTGGWAQGKILSMNKVLSSMKTAKALGGLNVLRRPSRPGAAGLAPGRPHLPNTYLPKFA